MFGSGQLGSVNPQSRYDKASKDLKKAEEAYAAAESELIKARRTYNNACAEWDRFNFYGQSGA